MKGKLLKNITMISMGILTFIISFSILSLWMPTNGIWSNIFVSICGSLGVYFAVNYRFKRTLEKINPVLFNEKNNGKEVTKNKSLE
jgi:uncharacterized membrane protein